MMSVALCTLHVMRTSRLMPFEGAITAPLSLRARRLSHEDGIWRPGTNMSGAAVGSWHSPSEPKGSCDWARAYYFNVHLPKTAGSSFALDAPRHVPPDAWVRGGEKSWLWVQRKLHQEAAGGSRCARMVLFVRHPTAHVYSQFMECKYSQWGRRQTQLTGFPRGRDDVPYSGLERWLDVYLRWEKARGQGGRLGHMPAQSSPDGCVIDQFRCYVPWNLQARYIEALAANGSECGCNGGKLHAGCAGHLSPRIDVLRDRIDSTPVVLISEFYSESLCLLEWMARGVVSARCLAAVGKADAGQSHITHGVPAHSPAELSEPVLAKIRRLTAVDLQLYAYALRRFGKDVSRMQLLSGVNLIGAAVLKSLLNGTYSLVA